MPQPASTAAAGSATPAGPPAALAPPAFVDPAEYRRRRATAELYRRTLSGAAFCALGAAITGGVGGYFQRQPGLMAAVLAAFGLLHVMRWAHRPPQDMADRPANERWARRHWWMVVGTGLVWCGFLIAVGAIEQRATTTFFVVAMVTVAFATASVEALALNRRWALATVSLQQLPALLVLWFAAPGLRGISLVLLAYWIYQALHLGRRAKEYDAQMEIESTLVNSRAEVERLSRQDGLTGLSNRRDYEVALETLWHLGARERADLSLLVIDLDHFKRINDGHGHSAGDACLKHAAGLMREAFKRDGDVLARIGGEEFAVLLPKTNLEQARALAQAYCTRLAESAFMFEGHRIAVTASIGVGAMNWAADASPQASFSRVDAACYAAKAQGRNRVACA